MLIIYSLYWICKPQNMIDRFVHSGYPMAKPLVNPPTISGLNKFFISMFDDKNTPGPVKPPHFITF